jgi:hypothetical protein
MSTSGNAVGAAAAGAASATRVDATVESSRKPESAARSAVRIEMSLIPGAGGDRKNTWAEVTPQRLGYFLAY